MCTKVDVPDTVVWRLFMKLVQGIHFLSVHFLSAQVPHFFSARFAQTALAGRNGRVSRRTISARLAPNGAKETSAL